MQWLDALIEKVTPKSAAEQAVDAMGFVQPPEPTARQQLSTWDKIKESIVPQSYGEALVEQLYGPGSNPATPPPEYDPSDLSSPNVFVHARDTAAHVVQSVEAVGSRILGNVGASISGVFLKVSLIAGVVLLLMVFVHGFAGRK